MSTVVANSSGVVVGNDGRRLYGMDAELHLKREAQRDADFEMEVARWIESAVGEPLLDASNLWVSLKSGVVLCRLVNAIVPGTIKKFAQTNLLPLMEMDNIQLYLKACWNLGVPSGDFFIVSDLYHQKSIHQVIQNIVSLSRVAPNLGYQGAPLVAGNTGKDRVKAWEPVVAGGAALHVDELLEKGGVAERLTQLTVELGAVQHEAQSLRAEVHNAKTDLKEATQQHRAAAQRWQQEKEQLLGRLQKFAPLDDGQEGAPGQLALEAQKLLHQEQLDALQKELNAERERTQSLETKLEDLRSKYSSVSAELSKIRFDAQRGGGAAAASSTQHNKPAWMAKVHAKKQQEQQQEQAGGGRERGRTRTKTVIAERMVEPPLPRKVTVAQAKPQEQAGAQKEPQEEEEVVYRGRFSTMMQLKAVVEPSKPGEQAVEAEDTGFFFNSEDLDADGLEYMSEQVEILFANEAIEDEASTIMNEMLLSDSGRRAFTFVLKEKLRKLHFQKVCLDTGPFLQVLSLINSSLTGMQLDSRVDYIAMTFLLGVSRAIYTTGSKSKMEEYLADQLRDHSIWSDVRFWEQHFWDVIGKAFKKKFSRLSIGSALGDGWSDDHLKFLAQFVATFADETKRWAVGEDDVKQLLSAIFERLSMPTKYQEVTKAFMDKLATAHNARAAREKESLRHVSMVMSQAQAARIMGNLRGQQAAAQVSDTNILQGWLKRKVHIMWITEWVDQVGTHLIFREYKQATQKRIVINLNQITRVEVRQDSSLQNSRVIFIEAGQVKATVAPVKDTDEEVNYWVNGLKKMQGRFNLAPGKTRQVVQSPLPKSKRDALGGSGAVPAVSATVGIPAAASLEGLLKINFTDAMISSGSFIGVSAGWSDTIFASLQEPRLILSKGRKAGGPPVGFLDLNELSHMPEVTQADAIGKVLRLHMKGGSLTVDLGGFDPAGSFDNWLKTLTAFKKKAKLAAIEQNSSGSSLTVPGAEDASGPVAAVRTSSRPRSIVFGKDVAAAAVSGADATTSSSAAATEVVAHTFKVGDMVWAQFSDDQLWYRAVIYYVSPGAAEFKVVFVEYGNTQDCARNILRPIGDPAMLALLGKPLEDVLSSKSVDQGRPMFIQVPTAVVAELRRGTRAGTIMQFDPRAVLKQQAEEMGDDAQPEQQQQQLDPRALQRPQSRTSVVAPPPAATEAGSPGSAPFIQTPEAENEMFDLAIEDDDGSNSSSNTPQQESSKEDTRAAIRDRLARRSPRASERSDTVDQEAAARVRARLEARKQQKGGAEAKEEGPKEEVPNESLLDADE